MSKKKKIGIITYWESNDNYGQQLQCWALQHFLRKRGYDASLIRYVIHWRLGEYMQMPYRSVPKNKVIKRVVKDILIPFYYYLPDCIKRGLNPYFYFYHKHCKMTSACTEESISACCEPFTTIISGSDQIWHPHNLDPIFLQSFVSGKVNQISYATSIGGKTLVKEHESIYIKNLRSFSAISVREFEGYDILKSMGIESEIHIDPTLLINVTHYRSIAKRIKYISKPFVFCYFLETDREYKSLVQQYVYTHTRTT